MYRCLHSNFYATSEKQAIQRCYWYRKLMATGMLCLMLLGPAASLMADDQPLEMQTFDTLLLLANKGNAPAQRILANMYEQGDSVDKDLKQAIKWYRSAAELNDDIAQFYLGYLYYQAIGLKQDYKLAFHWFAKAAEQGNADFQYNLGNLHRYGEGTIVNVEHALKWYHLAANQDQANAQLDLAHLYLKGDLVNTDLIQAYVWFSLALEQIDTRQEIKKLSENMDSQQLNQAEQNIATWVATNRGGYSQ